MKKWKKRKKNKKRAKKMGTDTSHYIDKRSHIEYRSEPAERPCCKKHECEKLETVDQIPNEVAPSLEETTDQYQETNQEEYVSD